MQVGVIDKNDQLTLLNQGDEIRIGNVIHKLQNNVHTIKNVGDPYNLFGLPNQTGDHFFFKDIGANTDGLMPFMSQFTGASPLVPPSYWHVVKWSDYKHDHSAIPDSSTYHMIEGGDCYYQRYIDPANPWETMPSAAQKAAALAFLNVDTQLLAQYPKLANVLSFYTYNQASLGSSTAVDQRNFGWRHVPANFHAKWTSIPANFVSGWYGFGTTHSAGEGFTNEHYDHVLYYFINYLLSTNSEEAFNSYQMGMYLLKTKCAYGLLWAESHPWRGWWRYEKGLNRRGKQDRPSPAKEWDLGLIIGYLLSGDSFLGDAVALRSESLLNFHPNAWVWDGAYGGRMLGNFLNCLAAHRKYAESQGLTSLVTQFDTKATSFINHVFTVNGTLDYFKVGTSTATIAGWEEAVAYTSIHWWMMKGVCIQHLTKLQSMIQWFIAHAGGWRDAAHTKFHVAYQVNQDGTINSITAPGHGAFWVRLWDIAEQYWPGMYTNERLGSLNLVYNYLPLLLSSIDAGQAPPADFGVEYGAMGPSAEKWWPILLQPLARI